MVPFAQAWIFSRILHFLDGGEVRVPLAVFLDRKSADDRCRKARENTNSSAAYAKAQRLLGISCITYRVTDIELVED